MKEIYVSKCCNASIVLDRGDQRCDECDIILEEDEIIKKVVKEKNMFHVKQNKK